MDWINRMNEALAYVEDNLVGEISLDRAAQIALSSQYQFQRLFSYMVGVPLSVYIRQRRLTKAALDLQSGDKVIDVAGRYGYDSPTAFNRAFQSVHGVPPSAAQQPDILLKAFPRISFTITVQGVSEMEYRIVSKGGFRIVGVRERISSDVEENFYYIAAATDKPVPEGMFELEIPAATWAIFKGEGVPGSIGDLQKRIFSEWLPTSGYEWATVADIEVYLNEDPVNMKYEVWLPVTKKA